MANEVALQEIADERSIEDELTAKLEGKKEPEEKPETEDEGKPEAKSEEPEEGQTEEEAEDPNVEEFEYEGKTYKAPKELKEAVLRHADYTQKTQALAEERKILQTERETLQIQAQFQEKHAEALTEFRALEANLKQYEGLNWDAIAAENPGRFSVLDRQERMLREQLTRKGQELNGIAAEFQREMAQQREKKLVAGRLMLRNEFKNDPADIGEKMIKTGESYGFTRAELDALDDPRQARVLRDAMKWRELQNAKPQIQKRAEAAKPVKVTTARSAQSTQSAAKVDELRTSLKKTGSPAAAEELFTRLLSRKR